MIVQGQGLGDTVYGEYSSDGTYTGGYRTERPWWGDLVRQGIDVTGQAITGNRGGYYGPAANIQSVPQNQSRGGFSLGSVGLGGVSISPITLLLGGAAFALIFFGKTRR